MSDTSPVVASFDGPVVAPTAPITPFKRPVYDSKGNVVLRVGGKGTRMPGKIPDLPPTPDTFAAHILTRNTHPMIAAAAKQHGNLQSNSELSLDDFDALVAEAGSIRINSR